MNPTSTKLLLAAAGLLISAAATAAQPLPYRDTTLSAEVRAEDLLHRLTLDEKIALMQNASPAIPRLGIRPYEWWNEALHGVARAGVATVFPQAVGMAASFDDSLVEEVFTAVSDEARAKNRDFKARGMYNRYQGLTMWTPNINIFRDPRWGRGQETYGEDPCLTARMGAAVVRGLQGPAGSRYDKLHACAKHFAVHSGPEWNRHSFNAAEISPRDLNETYLPAFKTLVQDAGVKEVMGAYNRFEGKPCCGSDYLLTRLLRDEWGFRGLVVSDCGAIRDFYMPKAHHTHPDAAHASASAVESGCDLECGSSYAALAEAVRDGLIEEARIDTAVRRLLTARFALGEMEEKDPFEIPYEVVDCPAHRELALRIAHESLVLLQNRGSLLPLNRNMKIAVLGPNADDPVMQWGNYNGFPSNTVTLLEGIREKLPDAQILYDPCCGLTDSITYRSLMAECAIDGAQGFDARYWNNSEFSGDEAAADRLTSAFHFSGAGGTVFAPGVELEGFTARYRTEFQPTRSGTAVFRLMTNGNVRISIDGIQIVDRTNVKNPATVHTFAFEAGKRYGIEVLFTQIRKDPTLDFDLAEVVPTDFGQLLDRIRDVDAVIFAGGISALLEGEEMSVSAPGFKGGDRTDIELPAVQRNLLEALKRSGKRIVLVNFSGSAMGLEPETESCDAIVQAWYPGQAGGTAVADLLFGDYNPAGRLPVTFYRNIAQLPDYEDYNMQGRTYRYLGEDPLFPFGYGLSYTTFRYGRAAADRTRLHDGQTLRVRIPVTNTGDRDGEEVVQLYLQRTDDPSGPVQTLRAFRRIPIAAGATETVVFELTEKDFEWFDPETNSMRPLPGTCILRLGGSSRLSEQQTLRIRLK